MTPTLRPYQSELELDVQVAFELTADRVLVVLPTGGGKTVLFSKIAANDSEVTWVIAHRQELIRQASETLNRFGIDHGTVKSGFPFQPEKRVQVASMQTLVRRAASMPRPGLIVLDECFPPGTLIDGRPIEDIHKGDFVWSFNHDTGEEEPRKVLGTMARQHGGLWFRITTDDGSRFVCTENHPVFVEGIGYVPAKQLHEHTLPILRKIVRNERSPKEVLQLGMPGQRASDSSTRHDLLYLQKGFHPERHGSGRVYAQTGESLLLPGVRTHRDGGEFQEDYGSHEPEVCVREDASEKPDAHPRDTGEDEAVNDWAEVQGEGWKRKSHSATRSLESNIQFGNGVGYSHEGSISGPRETPKQLQGGPSPSCDKTCDRGGRERTPSSEKQNTGRQEGSRSQFTRLVGIEVYERGSGPRPSWVPEQDTVHNIHVEGNNNYYAEGILVHNCHHALCPTIAKILATAPGSRVLGVTATPCRLNGSGLGAVFQQMLIGPTNRWLTEQGFLSPAEYYAPPPQADTSNLPIRGGDYAKEQAEKVMDTPVVTGDAVSHYREICEGVPMLVFCVSVEHAKHVASQYSEAGYRAASVDGSLDDDERYDRINGLATGKYQVITSCDLIGEGLDVPVVGAVQLLRPTESLALHLQQIGRGLRPAPGKKVTYVLDHVGNVVKHRFASTEHQWTLDGKVKPVKEKPEVIRTCGECFRAHETAKTCPYCGFVYPVKSRSLTKMEIVDGKLVRLEETPEARAEEMRAARSMPELIAFAKSRGYKKPAFWARKVYQGRSYAHLMPKL